MLLTIGMIVKNEEHYLRRCLEALKPVLEQVSSELVIADTGSTDNTVHIAKEFTSEVFYFEWCNDFAKARNSTLEKASGEWYMQIDADEIIADTKPLIDFFNSGEYQQYNSAHVTIRSANDLSFKNYSDNKIARLFKKSETAFYSGSVHGYIISYPPIKDLDLILMHYGYIVENNKENIKEKFNGRLNLLLQELNKNQQSSMLYYYISNYYSILEDYRNGLKFSKNGLKYANETEKYILYANMIIFLYQLDRFSEVIDYANDYLKLKDTSIGTDLDIYALAAYSYANLDNRAAAINSFEKYIYLFKEYKKGLLNTPDIILRGLVTGNEQFYYNAKIVYSQLLIDQRQFETARNTLLSIDINDLQQLDSTDRWLKTEINLMMNTNDFSRANDLKTLLDPAAYKTLQNIVEGELQKYFLELTRDSLSTEYVNDLFFTNSNLFTIYQSLSKEDLSENDIQLLSESIQTAYYCLQAEVAKKVKDYNGYIKYLRFILKLCSQMKNSINLLAVQAQNVINEADAKKSEFETYAIKVKESIRNLINNGNANEAIEILKMYEKLCPDDLEIEILKMQIS